VRSHVIFMLENLKYYYIIISSFIFYT